MQIEVRSIIEKQIKNDGDINTCCNEINEIFAKYKLPTIKLDDNKIIDDFNSWITEVIDKEPIPKNIKCIHFGLTKMSFPNIDDGKEKTTIYVSGSIINPEEDKDWACDTEYFPSRRYLLLECFENIDDLIKQDKSLGEDYEILVFSSILNQLIIQFVNKYRTRLLTFNETKLLFFNIKKQRELLYFSSGYDSGESDLVRKIK